MPVKWKTEKMQKSVRDLKPLDREPKNFAAWWHIAEQIFHYGWLEEYEDHDSFRHYWANETYKGMSEKVKRGLIRRDIKKAIKQAFKSIARR